MRRRVGWVLIGLRRSVANPQSQSQTPHGDGSALHRVKGGSCGSSAGSPLTGGAKQRPAGASVRLRRRSTPSSNEVKRGYDELGQSLYAWAPGPRAWSNQRRVAVRAVTARPTPVATAAVERAQPGKAPSWSSFQKIDQPPASAPEGARLRWGQVRFDVSQQRHGRGSPHP